MNCPRCGTPMEGGVCPECGFPVTRLRRGRGAREALPRRFAEAARKEERGRG